MSEKHRDLFLLALACLIIGIPMYWFQSTHLIHFNVDWNIAFYPATRLLLQGQNPYSVGRLHIPIWGLIPLIPFAVLGHDLGGLLLFFFNLFTYAYVGYRFKGKPVALISLLLSPLVFYNLFLGNIDSLVLWGLLLPPPIGLFLIAIKPQIGIGVAVYLAYALWREGGWRKLLPAFAPVTVALVISFLVLGNWVANTSEDVMTSYWNFSFFPWSVPIGLFLLIVAIVRRKIAVSLSASPFFAPYISVGSWFVAFMGLLENNLAMVGAVFGLWLLYAAYAALHGGP
ncbi:MAG TPA: hypothetical protein VF784_14065 [Anaerolineales bacterium]